MREEIEIQGFDGRWDGRWDMRWLDGGYTVDSEDYSTGSCAGTFTRFICFLDTWIRMD